MAEIIFSDIIIIAIIIIFPNEENCSTVLFQRMRPTVFSCSQGPIQGGSACKRGALFMAYTGRLSLQRGLCLWPIQGGSACKGGLCLWPIQGGSSFKGGPCLWHIIMDYTHFFYKEHISRLNSKLNSSLGILSLVVQVP